MGANSIVIAVEQATLDDEGGLRVSGWAAGEAAVDSVEIIVAGVRVGVAEYGRARPDVAADHPQFVDAARSGFSLQARLSEHARQAQQAFIVVRAEGRPAQAVATTILRSGAAVPDLLRFHSDSVALFDDGEVEIIGWAAHPDEVVRMEVNLDGARIGEATVGKPRPDVGRSHPHIRSAARSGFEFAATLEAIAAGEHELTLDVFTSKGERMERKLAASTQIARASRRPDRQDIRLTIDTPAIAEGAFVQPVRGLLSIDGWAIARHGVAAVDVFLDGAPVGAALRGVRRADIAANFPDWPDALMSGFAILLPRKLFAKDKHMLRLVARDTRGEVQELEALVTIEADDFEDERTQLRAFVPEAEIEAKRTLIAAGASPPVFAVMIGPGEAEAISRTLDSLARQAFGDFRAVFLAPTDEAGEAARALAKEAGVALAVWSGQHDGDLGEAVAALFEGEARRPFALRLRGGDRLGADALLEFALEIVLRPEEDFLYADDRRPDPGRGKTAPWLKPEWSPDLMLSTNYIGRTWCAGVDLLRRAGLTLAAAHSASDYDFALRLTEAAREIGRAPLILAETGPADSPERERAALAAAMARRGIAGAVRALKVPGVYRLRRRVRAEGLVSIVIPSIGSRGLIEACVKSLRERTWYRKFEIVCVDNVKDEDSPWKDWFRRNADCVVEYSGPFNWSKLNNLGAQAARGEYLLFLNDDIEAIEPRWLHALLEHAARPEVGLVAPRLVYPDGRVQHAGLFLHDDNARHAFRFADRDEPGPFGLAACQRNVIAATGAAMLMRRDAFDEVGGFDEAHSVVNNDVDICLRMWRAGLRVVYTPHATLIHHEMASRSELQDEYDPKTFKARWGAAFALGDPFFHPRLSRDRLDYAIEAEPARVLVAGGPLIARQDVRRILALKLDHVGDFVTCLPAIQRLKARFPRAEIHLLAPKASVALARLEPAIDAVIEFNFFHAISQQGARDIDEAEWAELEARLKPYRFDLAIDLRKHTDAREALKRSGARLKAGFDHRRQFPWLDIALEWDGDQRHFGKRNQVAEDYLALVEMASIACESRRGVLAGPGAEAARAALAALPALTDLRPGLLDRPLVGVHPGAGAMLRQWPTEHFASLIDLLVDAFDVNVALIGAPNEAAIAEATLEGVGAVDRVWSLVGKTEMSQLPTLLKALRLFVGNNSGPHHLAAALGTPTVGVHSAVVSAREWGPLGPMAVAVQREMTCGPCYLEKPTQCARGLACLQGLRPGDVFRVCEQMLGPALRHGAA